MENLILSLARITELQFIVLGDGGISFMVVNAHKAEEILNKEPGLGYKNIGWGDFVFIKEGKEVGRGHLYKDSKDNNYDDFQLTFYTDNQQ